MYKYMYITCTGQVIKQRNRQIYKMLARIEGQSRGD